MWQGSTLHQLLVYKRWVVSHSTCCTMLSISSAPGKFIPGLCLVLPKDSTWPGQVQSDVLRAAIKGQGIDKLLTVHCINSSLTSSRMSWKLQWTTDNMFFSACFLILCVTSKCSRTTVVTKNTCYSAVHLIYFECEVGRDISPVMKCQDFVHKPFNHMPYKLERFYFQLALMLLLCC